MHTIYKLTIQLTNLSRAVSGCFNRWSENSRCIRNRANMRKVKISCRCKESWSSVMKTLITLVKPQSTCTIIRHEFVGGSKVLIMIRDTAGYKIRKYPTSARAISHLIHSARHFIDKNADRKETERFVPMAVEQRNALYSGVTHNFDERCRATGKRLVYFDTRGQNEQWTNRPCGLMYRTIFFFTNACKTRVGSPFTDIENAPQLNFTQQLTTRRY